MKTKNGAYTGMLVISLVAMVAGCIFTFLDIGAFGPEKPPEVMAARSTPK